jgi:hypothetical protein
MARYFEQLSSSEVRRQVLWAVFSELPGYRTPCTQAGLQKCPVRKVRWSGRALAKARPDTADFIQEHAAAVNLDFACGASGVSCG